MFHSFDACMDFGQSRFKMFNLLGRIFVEALTEGLEGLGPLAQGAEGVSVSADAIEGGNDLFFQWLFPGKIGFREEAKYDVAVVLPL